MAHGDGQPSPWVQRWAHLISAHAPVLDVACGRGRHMQYLHALGHHVTGVDKDEAALAVCAQWGSTVCADIENNPWPLEGQTFSAVVVTNYLWRPVWPQILKSLAPQGVLIYETFGEGQAHVGKPSRPDFLLRPGELLAKCEHLHVVAYENGFLNGPGRYVQRIAAVQTGASENPSDRHLLSLE